MYRYLSTALFSMLAFGLLAQAGVDVNPPTDPDPGVGESPTLWILLALVLLGGLFFLRSRTKRVGRD
ncbi:MYXO-CTERM domain-containing protein [Neolewinella xylanilytica]|uniref:MYXO-CTERM domain-containing protein n=1 Tax=Neolewinella xylanilytica TaxID=1514080 RepID=A0A2S6I0G1_9BACT|nr:hypothetical protein [Neolewinella xylanilytica]PPK84353.1 MYXO-CTERM domain-containing protein [Neolewinella xylanilytica]